MRIPWWAYLPSYVTLPSYASLRRRTIPDGPLPAHRLLHPGGGRALATPGDTSGVDGCAADTGCPDLSGDACPTPGILTCDCCDALWDCQGHPDGTASSITTTFGCGCLTEGGGIDTGNPECQLGE